MDSHKSIQEFLRELKSRKPDQRTENEKLFLRYNEFILYSIANFKNLAKENLSVDWDDVYQDAAVALLELAKDSGVRKKFPSYIQSEIIRAIQHSVSVATQFQDFIARLKIELILYQQHVRELRAKFRREPSTAEISKSLGLPHLQVAQLRRLYQAAHNYEIIDCLTE